MKIVSLLLGIASAVCLAGGARAVEQGGNPLGDFLKAADNNDFTAMRTLLDDKLLLANGSKISSADFVEKVSNCYLRRVYKNDIAKRLIAAWMCDEGAGKSRVVVATLGTDEGKVQLIVEREDRNDLPAPPRTGSAFAEEPSK